VLLLFISYLFFFTNRKTSKREKLNSIFTMARKSRKSCKTVRARSHGKKRRRQKGGLAPLALKVAAPYVVKGLKKLFSKRRRR